MNLFAASNQWATRPDDERFETLKAMLDSCNYYRNASRTALLPVNRLRAEAVDGEIRICGEHTSARMTNWAFSQVARLASAPPAYLRTLPAPLACQNLNHALPAVDTDGRLLLHQNGDLILRCVTSEDYVRIWNGDVINRLIDLQGEGWRVPPARPARQGQAGTRPATEADILAAGGFLSVNVGDLIAPAGLYASDHDMFAFMVNEDRRIDDGSEGGLSRGFFVSNSEVGAGALKLTTFLYRHVCGNHIVWGAKNVSQSKIIHRGNAENRFNSAFLVELKQFADESASEDQARITHARTQLIAGTKDDVIDTLFGRKLLSRRDLTAAYAYAEQDDAVVPNTTWGMAQGITRLSQETPYMDQRVEMDRAAGKVLEMSF